MRPHVPGQILPLLIAGLFGFIALRNLYIYHYKNGGNDGLTDPDDRSGWLKPEKPVRNIATLVLAIALSFFTFTDTATNFANGPHFQPSMLIFLGAMALLTVVYGLSTGKIVSTIGYTPSQFNKASESTKYWLAMAWNSFVGLFMLFIAFVTMANSSFQQLEAACLGEDKQLQTQEIVTACDQLLNNPNDRDEKKPLWLEARGVAFANDMKFDRALRDYDAAISGGRREASTLLNRGIAHYQLGQNQQALADLDSAIAIDANLPLSHSLRGTVLLELGRIDAAIASFDKALQLSPDDSTALASRGLAQQMKGNLAAAERDQAAAEALDPTAIPVLRGRVRLSTARGDLNGARQRLDAMLQQDPDDEWALRQRAEVYRFLGDKVRADADKERADRALATEFSSASN